jgi:hypothetical protein
VVHFERTADMQVFWAEKREKSPHPVLGQPPYTPAHKNAAHGGRHKGSAMDRSFTTGRSPPPACPCTGRIVHLWWALSAVLRRCQEPLGSLCSFCTNAMYLCLFFYDRP